jgi:hypothetical protein
MLKNAAIESDNDYPILIKVVCSYTLNYNELERLIDLDFIDGYKSFNDEYKAYINKNGWQFIKWFNLRNK